MASSSVVLAQVIAAMLKVTDPMLCMHMLCTIADLHSNILQWSYYQITAWHNQMSQIFFTKQNCQITNSHPADVYLFVVVCALICHN